MAGRGLGVDVDTTAEGERPLTEEPGEQLNTQGDSLNSPPSSEVG
jgi:hypothetical protein